MKIISEEAEARAQQQHLKDEEAAKAIARKNPPFLQLSKSALADVRMLAKRSPPAFQVMHVLVEKMNRQNAVVCSQRILAKITGYSIPTVKRAVQLLESERWMQIIKVGTANAYVINSKVYWQSSREGRFAVFNASVIADHDEQILTAEDWEDVELRTFPFIMPGETAILHPNEPLPPPDQGEIDL